MMWEPEIESVPARLKVVGCGSLSPDHDLSASWWYPWCSPKETTNFGYEGYLKCFIWIPKYKIIFAKSAWHMSHLAFKICRNNQLRGVGTYTYARTGPDKVFGKLYLNLVRDKQNHTNRKYWSGQRFQVWIKLKSVPTPLQLISISTNCAIRWEYISSELSYPDNWF